MKIAVGVLGKRHNMIWDGWTGWINERGSRKDIEMQKLGLSSEGWES